MIGVTGAAGAVGSRVVRALPAARALTRRDADYEDQPALRRAFAGLRMLVFISSDGVAETMRRHHEHIVAAAVDAGVEHVIYTSVLDIAPDSRFYYAPVHRDTEALLKQTGMRVCFARTSIFTEFFEETWIEPARAAGTLAIPAGDGRLSLVSRDDVARALAAAALAERTGIVDVAGPEALTAAEVAARHGLRYEALDEPEYRRRLAGEPGWLVEAYASMFRSVREGRWDATAARPAGPRSP